MKLFVSSFLFLFSGDHASTSTCAFSACRIRIKPPQCPQPHPHPRTHQKKTHVGHAPLWALTNSDAIITATEAEGELPPIIDNPNTNTKPLLRWQHPSQPEPDYSTIRKEPVFPGAIPVEAQDITTCINQIGQTSPANVLLGKPRYTACKHGYAQAFSLNPMPTTFRSGTSKKNKQTTQRFNSGLMKLTCPLLVNSIDILEDDGFMSVVNSKLAENEEWMECMNESHVTHATARKELVLGDGEDEDDHDDQTIMNVLESKLGQRGAKSFLAAGVAGAMPSQSTSKGKVDVKCLHAWMADALFHPSMNNDNNSNDEATEQTPPTNHNKQHLIGDAIVEALNERGVDISGTETCHEVCSGCSQKSTACSSNNVSVHVPYPTNKGRRKRSVAVKEEVQ